MISEKSELNTVSSISDTVHSLGVQAVYNGGIIGYTGSGVLGERLIKGMCECKYVQVGWDYSPFK